MFLNQPTVDLFDSVIRLSPGGSAEPTTRAALSDADWPDVRIVAAFHAGSDLAVHPDVWERHPAGDEVLCVLSGAMNVYLRDGDDAEHTATVRGGECVIVPAGRWHRLSVVEPADLLAITPPAGTAHEPVAATARADGAS